MPSSNTRDATITPLRLASALASTGRYQPRSVLTRAASPATLPGASIKLARVGIIVIASAVPQRRVKVRVRATGRKIRPSTRCMVNRGTNAVTMIAVEKSCGLATSVAPVTIRAGRERTVPPFSSRRRRTFSMTKTAGSTMIPKSTAPMEIRFAGIPRAWSRMKEPRRDRGITKATMVADLRFPRPRKATRTTSTSKIPSPMFLRTV